jgi:phosphohistidine swiveling domain-containing protein
MMYLLNSKDRSGITAAAVGRKAYNLFLLQEHFPVPEFVVIPTKAYDEYQAGQLIPRLLQDELRDLFADWLKDGPLAIRSSATSEDLPGLSFAGLYATILGVHTVEQGLAAVEKVWASLNAERVVIYCRKMGAEIGNMAVIVQHQLKPDTSGVLVTQSPFNVNEILVECCEGLGEKLVSGAIAPQRFRIKGNKIIEQPDKPMLAKKELAELTDAGKEIERLFGSPQDIEWAFEKGRLYILQSRPVFVYSSIPRRHCTVWCNVNVRETIPDPVSPLMWSLFEKHLFPMIILDAFGFPISRKRFKEYAPVDNISGRLYWNMNNAIAYGRPVGPLIDTMGMEKNLDPQMATALKAIDVKKLPELLPPFQATMYGMRSLRHLTILIVKSLISPGSIKRKFGHELNNEFIDRVIKIRLADDLADGLKVVESHIAFPDFASRYFTGIFLSIFYLILLQKLLGLRMGTAGEALARKAITGLIDKTGEMAIAIDELATTAAVRRTETGIKTLKDLYERDTEFKKAFDAFIKSFGHRGPAEFDIASKTYREDPGIVFAMIEYPRKARNRMQEKKHIIDDMLKSLKPVERRILRFFLPRLEMYVPMRENGKHYYFRQQEKLKEQLLMMGRALIAKGALEQERDIFFLSLDDLANIVKNTMSPSQAREIVESRKKEREQFKNAPVPDIIYSSGERVAAEIKHANTLRGEPLSYGTIRAKACVISDIMEGGKLKSGEIMVTNHSDPGWTPLFTIASGVIVEVGGLICHAAMVARELGIPAVVLKGATALIKDGQMIEMDAGTGRVTILDKSEIRNTTS